MPKVIKKKPVKDAKQEEEVSEVLLEKSRELYEKQHRQIGIALLSFIIAVGLVVGVYYMRSSNAQELATLQYAGYKQLYGLYDEAPKDRSVRLASALDNFQKAYQKSHASHDLLFVAISQYELGDYTAALSSLDEFDKTFQADKTLMPIAHIKKAHTLMQLKRDDEAMKLFDSIYTGDAIMKDFALVAQADALDSMQKKNESIVKLETLIKEFPDSPLVEDVKGKLESMKQAGSRPVNLPIGQKAVTFDLGGGQQQGSQQPAQPKFDLNTTKDKP